MNPENKKEHFLSYFLNTDGIIYYGDLSGGLVNIYSSLYAVEINGNENLFTALNSENILHVKFKDNQIVSYDLNTL